MKDSCARAAGRTPRLAPLAADARRAPAPSFRAASATRPIAPAPPRSRAIRAPARPGCARPSAPRPPAWGPGREAAHDPARHHALAGAGLALRAAIGLFQVKYEVQAQEQRARRVSRQIHERSRGRSTCCDAEWALSQRARAPGADLSAPPSRPARRSHAEPDRAISLSSCPRGRRARLPSSRICRQRPPDPATAALAGAAGDARRTSAKVKPLKPRDARRRALQPAPCRPAARRGATRSRARRRRQAGARDRRARACWSPALLLRPGLPRDRRAAGRRGAAAEDGDRSALRAERRRPAPVAERADIVDRNGVVLATTLATASLYANPRQMTDPATRRPRRWRAVLPDLNARRARRPSSARTSSFVWIKRDLTPRQQLRGQSPRHSRPLFPARGAARLSAWAARRACRRLHRHRQSSGLAGIERILRRRAGAAGDHQPLQLSHRPPHAA